MGHRLRRAIVGMTVAALSLSVACSSKSNKAASDVKVSACASDPGGGRPTAKGTVTNPTKKDSSYAFRVTFSDSSGNRVSEGAATLGRVKPGETADWSATGAAGANGTLTCKITNAVRTAVPNP